MDNIPVIAKAFELPPFFFPGFVRVVSVPADRMDLSTDSPASQFPLTFQFKGLDDLKFPIDPMINVQFKNVITRRTVAKHDKRGSVKERWTEDDADITISGIFIGSDGKFPSDMVSRLNEYKNSRGAIDVTCSLLNEMHINRIVIESVSYPHTKGPENQAFEIKAYSDDVFQLLIEG